MSGFEKEASEVDLTAFQALALGDSLAIDDDLEEAIDAYAAGLIVASNEGTTDLSNGSLERFRLLSHRSAAFYKLGRFSEALEDAQAAREEIARVTASASSSASGLRSGESETVGLRMGKALYQLGRYEPAKRVLDQVLQLAELNKRVKTSAETKEWIARCVEELEPPQLEPARPTVTSSASVTPALPVVAPRVTTTTTTTTTTATNYAAAPVRVQPPRYQYYQSDKFMTVVIVEPNVRQEHLQVNLQPDNSIRVVLNKQGHDFVVISGHLQESVDLAETKTVFKDEKVLIKLKKQQPKEWYDLLAKKKGTSSSTSTVATSVAAASTPLPVAESPTTTTSSTTTSIPRPYASHKDWDKIEKEIAEEDSKEIPEGDAAAMKLFRQIYANANEDTRRAMIKSYQTSGGTVLSTNWDEVSKKDYEKERTAPGGQEWKTWEGEKLK